MYISKTEPNQTYAVDIMASRLKFVTLQTDWQWSVRTFW